MKSKKILGNALLLVTAIIWGTAFVFQRMGADGVEPMSFTAARMAISAVAVGVVALILRRRDKTERSAEEAREYRKNTLLGGVLCGTCLAAATILQQFGLSSTTAGKAGFITAMYMLLVPIFGFLLLKKRNPPLVWFAVALGVVGMYFLCITEDLSLTLGDGLVCLCAVVFSFHILTIDRFAKLGDPVSIAAVQFATATVISAVGAALFETPSVEKLAPALIPILYCGLMSGGVAYTLQIVAQRYTDPAVASLLMSMEAVFAVISGAIILGETLTLREGIGCAIMLAAIILVQFPDKKPKKA